MHLALSTKIYTKGEERGYRFLQLNMVSFRSIHMTRWIQVQELDRVLTPESDTLTRGKLSG